MMHPEVEKCLRLQDFDRKSAALRKEIAELPKHIAVIEKQLDSHLRKLEVDRAALAANQKERKQREFDIQAQEQKISKLKDQMLLAKTNEQYRAFQHEIEYAQNEIRKAEDRILELMEEGEPLAKNVNEAEVALAEEKKSVEAEKNQARERTAVDQKALAEVSAERQTLLDGLETRTRQAYERLLRKWPNSVFIADATEGRCTACFMPLRPQFFQDLKISEQLMFCESCGRVLYYQPPVSFEADLASREA
ncbi:MAG: C4-type zinc ribbon domain-containing protein [Bryobacter sp.]|nr:C4-type zinc ribbon domain-containing protein [Bryobacter sp.]